VDTDLTVSLLGVVLVLEGPFVSVWDMTGAAHQKEVQRVQLLLLHIFKILKTRMVRIMACLQAKMGTLVLGPPRMRA
jgi:hypothetical protein